jgi:hypothetical protein
LQKEKRKRVIEKQSPWIEIYTRKNGLFVEAEAVAVQR